MTKIQIKFFNLISNLIIDFDAIFHKDLIIVKIKKIDEDKLKYLLENITEDKDNLIKNKTYTTYAKFVYYANKMIDSDLAKQTLPYNSTIDILLEKRRKLIDAVANQQLNMAKRKQLIDDIASKKLMFKGDDGKSLLSVQEYYILNQFGFYSFLDENNNYKIKEKLEIILKQIMIIKQNKKENKITHKKELEWNVK